MEDNQSSTIPLKWLRDNFMEVSDDKQLDQHVRAFVLYVLGTMIFTNGNDRIGSRFLEYLVDVDDIKSYAWGAAVLAQIHHSLEKAFDRKSMCFCGCTILLTIWASLHIVPLRSSLLKEQTQQSILNHWPLATHLIDIVAKDFGRRFNSSEKYEYLKSLSEDDIIYDPYLHFNDDLLPDWAKEHRKMRACKIILGHPLSKTLIYHDPGSCPNRLGQPFTENGVSMASVLPKNSWKKCVIAKWNEEQNAFLERGARDEPQSQGVVDEEHCSLLDIGDRDEPPISHLHEDTTVMLEGSCHQNIGDNDTDDEDYTPISEVMKQRKTKLSMDHGSLVTEKADVRGKASNASSRALLTSIQLEDEPDDSDDSFEENQKVWKKKCTELEEKHRLELLEVRKKYSDLGAKYEFEIEEKLRVAKMCKELERKHELELQEKLKAQNFCKELEVNYLLLFGENDELQKMYAGLQTKYQLEQLKLPKAESKYEELEEKYQFELLEKLRVEKKYKDLEENHKLDDEQMLNAYNELDSKHDFESKEKLRVEKLYEELGRKYNLEMAENHRLQSECKQLNELVKRQKMEMEKKLIVENELIECKDELDRLKKEQSVNNERYEACRSELERMKEAKIAASERLKKRLEDMKNRRDEDQKVTLKPCRKSDGMESIKPEYAESDRPVSELAEALNAERLLPSSMENEKMKCSITSDHVLRTSACPGNGLESSGTSKSSSQTIQLSDSDDDNVPEGKKLKGLKRTRPLSDNDDSWDDSKRDLFQAL